MLRTNQVSFRYPQNGHGLSPFSLQISPAKLTLVTGSSGSGKSTLARCLMGLIPHLYNGEMTGEVWLDGERTADLSMWQLAQKSGMVFQNPSAQMLAPTVEDEIIFGLENLGLERSEISERLERYLTQFDLAEMRSRSPLTLSGGEQQKLALAAVVARQPQALILDEPLSMLDTTAALALIGYLEEQVDDGKAVAIFEHRAEYLAGVEGVNLLDLNGTPAPEITSIEGLNLHPRRKFSLEIEGVTVAFGDHTPLKNLSLSLPGGQMVAIVGRNGVGKTTLLRVITGLQKHSGDVKISSPAGTAAPDLGMVFQNPDLQLFNSSVREEILYRIPDPDLVHYAALLDALGLRAYEATPPLLLSEGEKKRLALALVLMRKPRHGVLLDEPSLGQDSHHKAILVGLLRLLADAGQLVVITTHDLPLASQADRLILLGGEGVIADGEPAEVFTDAHAWGKAGIKLPGWFTDQHLGADV